MLLLLAARVFRSKNSILNEAQIERSRQEPDPAVAIDARDNSVWHSRKPVKFYVSFHAQLIASLKKPMQFRLWVSPYVINPKNPVSTDNPRVLNPNASAEGEFGLSFSSMHMCHCLLPLLVRFVGIVLYNGDR